jgi:hypothetical protein
LAVAKRYRSGKEIGIKGSPKKRVKVSEVIGDPPRGKGREG